MNKGEIVVDKSAKRIGVVRRWSFASNHAGDCLHANVIYWHDDWREWAAGQSSTATVELAKLEFFRGMKREEYPEYYLPHASEAGIKPVGNQGSYETYEPNERDTAYHELIELVEGERKLLLLEYLAEHHRDVEVRSEYSLRAARKQLAWIQANQCRAGSGVTSRQVTAASDVVNETARLARWHGNKRASLEWRIRCAREE